MNTEIIRLDIECPFCKSYNYFEDETGFYICSNCNGISEIRCGVEMDYTYPMRTLKSKARNNDEELSEDENNNDNNNIEILSQKYSSDGETIMNISTTSVKSSKFGTSYFNDISSYYSKSVRKKEIKEEKTPLQKLLEIQECFSNVINLIITDFFENKNNEKKYKYFNTIMKYDANEKKILLGITKSLWMVFISSKYNDIFYPVGKRKKLVRSRINSINEEKEIKKNKEKEKKKVIKFKKKKEMKISEQLKLRRITKRNVFKIYNNNIEEKNINNFYNEKNFQPSTKKLNYLKKFIKEYDEVINFIKKDKCFDIVFETEEDKEKINISNIIEYEQLIKVCHELGINPQKEKNCLLNIDNNDEEEEDYNFESLIHLIFVKQQLNYNQKNDENNSQITNGINSNHFLFLIYQIFSYKKIYILLNDIFFLYNDFNYIKKLSFEEINFLYILNFKKIKSNINWFDNKLDNLSILKKAENIIDRITLNILAMPDFFNFLCKYILKLIHYSGKIKTIINNKYIVEYLCLGIIFFGLKIIYGLNDLPYMCLLINNITKKYFDYNDDLDLKEKLEIFKSNTKNDEICKLYNLFPSELDLINIFIKELKSRNENSLIIDKKQRKINYNKNYKNKYIEINLEYLYKNFYDDFNQDINNLEKKYKNGKKNINKAKDKKINKKKKKWKINFSKEFENKIDLIENPVKEYNPFIKEEFEFHNTVYQNKEANVEFPLPFDTFIRMNKLSQKILINYHRPSEMIFLYLFCEYFKIDYLSLRTIIKAIEYHIEKIYQ